MRYSGQTRCVGGSFISARSAWAFVHIFIQNAELKAPLVFFVCLFVLRKAISSMPKTGIVEKTEGHGGNRKMDVLESDRRHRLSCPISSLSLVSTVRNWDQVMMTN